MNRFVWCAKRPANNGNLRPRHCDGRASVDLDRNANPIIGYALIISVELFSVSTTVTTTIGKAFFIAAPAVDAGSLVSNEVLTCPSTFKRNRLSMGRA